ncbi:AAA family ATPase, partial [Methylogaea oryzae]|uniref:AAA family ATPase n=1 Tax=Methylogaea oryzae TaxID=1295382 RepID=UPI0020D0A5BD
MRLEKVKLAGFKSFVDPTVLPLPSNLVGIVGPNGCGKSNLIDAVRWVMGESSAKHLRGESMSDVVFNGSSTRKPVSMASVELVFDNSEGDAPGEFADYAQISVKRQVTRDASRPISSTTPAAAARTSPTSSSAPASARAATPSSSRAPFPASSRPSRRKCAASSRRPPASPNTRSGATRPKSACATRGKTWTVSTICAKKSPSSWPICNARPTRRKNTWHCATRSAATAANCWRCAGGNTIKLAKRSSKPSPVMWRSCRSKGKPAANWTCRRNCAARNTPSCSTGWNAPRGAFTASAPTSAVWSNPSAGPSRVAPKCSGSCNGWRPNRKKPPAIWPTTRARWKTCGRNCCAWSWNAAKRRPARRRPTACAKTPRAITRKA